ncbi:MAG: YajQ family cyclic di-GMP-binding protein [Pseudomonadota bacterium]
MPSFDIVSKIDMSEMKNAVNLAQKEIDARYDFKGSQTEIIWGEEQLEFRAEDDYKMRACLDILRTKMGKRGIGMRSLEPGDIEPSANRMLKQILKLRNGIDTDQAKIIVKIIKNSGLKVTASIMDERVRVTGKKIDDLQMVWAYTRAHKDVTFDLQMENMKD